MRMIKREMFALNENMYTKVSFGTGEKTKERTAGRYNTIQMSVNVCKRIGHIVYKHTLEANTHAAYPILQLNYTKTWPNIYFESDNNLNAAFYAIIQCV